ncbi:hypothetical protein UBN96_00360 [Helicobacter pylori]
MKTEKEVQKQVIETFKSMGYAYLGDLTQSDNENINKESLKAWLTLSLMYFKKSRFKT